MPPKTQIAAWLDEPKHGATLRMRSDILIPEPAEGEVLVNLEVTGFCHSDVHGIYGETPMETNIAGHEGVGRVVGVGKGVGNEIMGQLVGVKWLYSACGECEICDIRYCYCLSQKNSGRNVPGTFQQFVVSPLKYTTIIPEGLKPEHVAPLLCAGLTMYTAVAKVSKFCRKGDAVVVLGAGGGLGHLGVQIAKASGYRVFAVDSSGKEDICRKCGAAEFINFEKEDVETRVKEVTNGMGAHAIIVTAGSERAYQQAPKLLRNLGTLVCVGLPRMDFDVPVSPFEVVVRGLNVVGTSVGVEDDMRALLEMAARGEVMPHVEIFNLEDINEIMGKLAKFEIKGRAVLRVPQ